MKLKKFLQYIWLRSISDKRLVDYIGAIEGNSHYHYVREAYQKNYRRFCENLPPRLKQEGIDVDGHRQSRLQNVV